MKDDDVTLKRENDFTEKIEEREDSVLQQKNFLDEDGDTLNVDKYDRGVDSMRLRPGGKSVP